MQFMTEFRSSFQSEAQGESRHFRRGRDFGETQSRTDSGFL